MYEINIKVIKVNLKDTDQTCAKISKNDHFVSSI